MRDIIVPDVDDADAIEHDAESSESLDGVSGSAVAALIATLRLRYGDGATSGAVIVRWEDNGELIELQVEAWADLKVHVQPSVDDETSNPEGPSAPALDEAPSDLATTADPLSIAEPFESPRRCCAARVVASSRLFRHARR